ncbi:hypothetical protein TrCOL_g5823 [Triparma columacea]|uniref:Uncharacterized protein n=1 Tax=Triparma columacea TaxID=722753 RepID=A0A9W7GJE0_9STRA|nr:hypothetical protein TrCOL_g5823 [Triparma columacea]
MIAHLLPPWIAVPGEMYARLWHLVLSLLACNNILQLVDLARMRVKENSWNARMTCTCIFTLVCAFRSFLPRVDAERLCFWDLGLIQSPFVGRSFATVAEISFAYQCTRYWSRVVGQCKVQGSVIIGNIAWFLCSFAQVLCWTGVLTTNNFWHACENSLWGLSPFLLCIGAYEAVTRKEAHKHKKNLEFLKTFCATVPFFVAYLATSDVPMYIRKWREGVGGGVDLTIGEGFVDSMRCNVDRSDDLWFQEMPWMSGYFVFGPLIMMTLEKWDKELIGFEGKKIMQKEGAQTPMKGKSTRVLRSAKKE